ncbi:leucyl aminopeptidase family protein [Frankia sp. AgB1.9]|uniref:leucyl aminopeptidase family protein n=1 Tax=unclassified Frankia TaxID=2632575 RepID=UPI001934911C|nr:MULTISPECIES: M17 family metallopeptidase [unclassified Frankia]MBL7549674.1 leucyl aminopeptidase family protein [Frankia sp. AgB1.9]MBL7623131.1 leucyl aminopeptidase family protein [Frankia sp. AgB1.8]
MLAVVVLSSAQADTADGAVAVAAAGSPAEGDQNGATPAGTTVGVVSPAAAGACADLGLDLDALLTAHNVGGDAGSVLVVPLARAEAPTRLLLVGAGAGGVGEWRTAGAALARRAGGGDRLALVADPEPAQLAALTEGLALAAYKQPKGPGEPIPTDDLDPDSEHADGDHADSAERGAADVEAGDLSTGATDLAGAERDADGAAEPAGETDELPPAAAESVPAAAGGPGFDEVIVWYSGALTSTELAEATEAVRRASVLARAVLTARDLINTPSLVKSPEWLARRATAAARAAGLDATLLDAKELAAGGFGGLTHVGGGSSRPPYLVELRYQGPPAEDGPAARHRVLVGKGITFDSGGLSLKPPGSMTSMKTDMSGAAAVLATMVALPELGAPGKVTGLLCIAENMIGGAAIRPGDVISCWGGTTVEVLNTDAEGRLVLADGLAYAAGALGAEVLVDLATLTGAVSIALGRRTAGLFASDDALAGELTAAAERAGERVWRLPLVEEYRPALESTVADLANMGSALNVGGGSIAAALFLREFTAGLPWAHLDIAGTARSDADDAEITRGGTGWGVRTLLRWLTADPTLAGEAAGS